MRNWLVPSLSSWRQHRYQQTRIASGNLQRIMSLNQRLIELQWIFHRKLISIALVVLFVMRIIARAPQRPLRECYRTTKYNSAIERNRHRAFATTKIWIMRSQTMMTMKTCHLLSQAYPRLPRHRIEPSRSEHWIAPMTPVGLSVGRLWSMSGCPTFLVLIPRDPALRLYGSRYRLAAPK